MESVLSIGGHAANELLTKFNIKGLSKWDHKIFYFIDKPIGEAEDRFDAAIVNCIPGSFITSEMYSIILVIQYRLDFRVEWENDIENKTFNFNKCIDYWFNNPIYWCNSYPTLERDQQSYGCLYGKSIPYDPSESYNIVNLLY